jgi:hypothetical protein
VFYLPIHEPYSRAVSLWGGGLCRITTTVLLEHFSTANLSDQQVLYWLFDHYKKRIEAQLVTPRLIYQSRMLMAHACNPSYLGS